MKLVGLKIKNFRCFDDNEFLDIKDLTAIIGRNDIGKSTLLEALDAFFNDVIDKGDLKTTTDSNIIEITCIFDDLPNEIVLDTSVPTSFDNEHLLNAENFLEIKKTFNFNGRLSKAIYLVAEHPNIDPLDNLLTFNNTKLKNTAAELGIDLSGINKTKNPPIREAIRNNFEYQLTKKEIKVEGNLAGDNNLKNIWASLKKIMPIYSLFKADRTLNDKDEDVQDPMKSAIKETLAIENIRVLLDQVEEAVKDHSTKVADKTIEKLKDIDNSLAEKLKSDFSKMPTWEKIFDLTLLNEVNVPLNKRGSGIRRLILLSFFQAQAEKRKNETNAPSIIYGLEEPESSQHPDYQIMLIEALINLSESDGIQVLFSTHSSNLVCEIPINSIIYIYKNEDGERCIEKCISNEDNEYKEDLIIKITKSLGILPNPTDKIKVILFIEGINDIYALERYSKILNTDNDDIINLTKLDCIGYILTGGSNLKHYVNGKYLKGLNKPEIHIYDSDVEDYIKTANDINNAGDPHKIAFNTSKNEMENFLHHEAIQDAYNANNFNIAIPVIDDDSDVPELVARTKHEVNSEIPWGNLDERVQKEKADKTKKFLNTQCIDFMNIERIRDRGVYDELKDWFDKIEELCNL